jgi:DNA-binding CsgD family transcriptional regulator
VRKRGAQPVRGLIRPLDRLFLAPGYRYGEDNVGTNAIAMALRQARAALIVGEEHFADALTVVACAAAPVTDPRTGRILGAVSLTCQRDAASSLLVTVAKRASREIEQRLVDGMSLADRGSLELFLRARRQAKGPLVLVSARTMHTNTAAAALVQPPDHQLLWEWASRIRPGNKPVPSQLRLTSGLVVSTHARQIEDGGTVIAALLLLDPLNASGATPRRRSQHQSATGWASLTDAERSVAGVVADGATNREAAARLYISRHTVDYHLRQIFRKLDITSRVELARLVTQQAAAGAGVRPETRH